MVLSALLFAAAASLATYTPCDQRPLSLQETNIPGCLNGAGDEEFPSRCAEFPDATLVCECLMPGAGEYPTLRVGLRKGGEWVTFAEEEYLGGVSFGSEFSTADLDGDGKSEIIAAVLHGVSNGLAITYWGVYIWNGASLAAQPVDIAVQDFGIGSLAQPSGQRGCQILKTQWLWGREPKRYDGEYLIGCLYDYRNGRIGRAPGRCFSRRLLFSFRRTFAGDRPKTLEWLQDRRVVACEPGPSVPVKDGAMRESGISVPSKPEDLKCIRVEEATAQPASGGVYPQWNICRNVSLARCRSSTGVFHELWIDWQENE